MNTSRIVSSAFVIASLSLTFCGGGGGGSSSSGSSGTPAAGTVDGLEIAQQMSLVTTDESSVSGSLSRMVMFAEDDRFVAPTSGAFITDEPEYYVFDRSMEALEIINEILCYVDQTKYYEKAVVNAGPYVALVDATKCRKDTDHANDSSDQGSAKEQEFESWTVDSTRASASASQIVSFWIPMEEFGDTFTLTAKLTVTAPASDSNPFGEFSMDFLEGAGMYGNLSVSETNDGLIDMQFYAYEFGGTEEIHAIVSPDGTSGRAYVMRNFTGFGGENEGDDIGGGGDQNISLNDAPTANQNDYGYGGNNTFNIAFDDSHYLVNGERCMDRVNFDKNVWQYNLYDASGGRVERNSGFSLKLGEQMWGWASYWGVWIPEEADIESGDTVESGDGEDTYTYFKGKGRLVRRTRKTLPLEDFIGSTFSWWDEDDGQSYIVKLAESGDDVVIQKIANESCDETGCNKQEINPAQTIDLEPYEWIGLWKEGSINLVADENGELSRSMSVPFYAHEYVMPDDSILMDGDETVFKCYTNCLKPGLTADDLSDNQPYVEMGWGDDVEPQIYTFDPVTYTLTANGQDIAIAEGEEIDPTSFYSWGVSSGEMVTSDVEVESSWEIFDLETTYFWETGPSEWSHLSAVKDADGEFVSFDPPLKLVYDHSDGEKYFLEYYGDGQLGGIPWEESESEHGREWQQAFSIDDGSVLMSDDTPYFSKAMVAELSMQEDDLSACSDLSLGQVEERDNEFTDPDLDSNPCDEDSACQTLEQLLAVPSDPAGENG